MRYRVDRAWAILWTLSVTEIVSWGVLVYSPAVFLLPMERELGWTRAEVAAGPSIAMLTWALSAVPVGRWLDRHGTRALMTAGSCAAALVAFAWAAVTSRPAYYAIWAGIGDRPARPQRAPPHGATGGPSGSSSPICRAPRISPSSRRSRRAESRRLDPPAPA